jgi:UDP:flavonoid glycosyltransferase YjiC (YdhE family)
LEFILTAIAFTFGSQTHLFDGQSNCKLRIGVDHHLAKFLFATVPIHGHVSPGLPIARTLVEQGHEVLWYGTTKYREKIEATGASFTKIQSAKDFDDSRLGDAFPGRNQHKGLNQLKFDLKNIFFGEMIGYDADLSRLLQEFPANVVVMDSAFSGILPMKLKGKAPKSAVYGILPLMISSRDTAPFGFGMQPSSGAIGRLRNKVMNTFVQNVVFSDVQKHVNDLLDRLGAPRLQYYFMDASAMLNDLFLQGTCPSFEYPRSDLPKSVTFIGPYLPAKSLDYKTPVWWGELGGPRQVVLVTQGTIANEDFNQLLIPTIQALASEDVLVIVTTGNKPFENVNNPLPDNVRLEMFIPYHELLPHVDVMVTNAGYGGVQMAISYGVPLVVAGKSEDKPEVCARVEWSGIGINLNTERPTTDQLLHAIRQVLNQPSYKEKVKCLSMEFQSYDALQGTVQKLVHLSQQ